MTDAQALTRDRRAALALAAGWMGERFFRTFRPVEDAGPSPFDALLRQRDRRVGVTIEALWDPPVPTPEAELFESLVSSDLEATAESDGAYVLWVPAGAPLPTDEPYQSEFRLLIARGLAALEPGERRELRIPAILRLAKVEVGGSYVSVSGGLAPHWTRLSERIDGAFHLDSRALHRLPEEPAELDIIITRVRDRAALLQPQEVTDVETHDYWLVSRLPSGAPRGLTVVAAPPFFEVNDGTNVRRLLRRAVRRASEQRAAAPATEGGDADFSVLVLLAPLAHLEDEMVTAALRGMSPAAYGTIDLIVLVADGRVREVLQPRRVPWES
jgi:hypothetical protein